MSDHTDDMMPLKSAHFLVGESLVTIYNQPEKHTVDNAFSPLNRWRMVQKMIKHFWNRWHLNFTNVWIARYRVDAMLKVTVSSLYNS